MLLLLLFSFFVNADLSHAENPIPCELKWTGLPYDDNGVEHPECKPQILYSWLTSVDVINPRNASWPLARGIAFFHRTPLATSLYGRFSYRIKLKPDVKYVIDKTWEEHAGCIHTESEKKESVYLWVNKELGFSEYVLCSNDVIESWSFGLMQHYQEMRNEKSIIIQHGAENSDGFMNPRLLAHSPYSCKQCFQKYTIHDARNDGSLATLDQSIKIMEEVVASGKGRVYYPETGKSYLSGPEFDRHFEIDNMAMDFHKIDPTYDSIQIINAVASDQDVTKKVSDFCNKASCEYKISRKFLGINGSIPQLAIQFACCDPISKSCLPKKNQISVSGIDLENYKFRFSCGADGAASAEPLQNSDASFALSVSN